MPKAGNDVWRVPVPGAAPGGDAAAVTVRLRPADGTLLLSVPRAGSVALDAVQAEQLVADIRAAVAAAGTVSSAVRGSAAGRGAVGGRGLVAQPAPPDRERDEAAAFAELLAEVRRVEQARADAVAALRAALAQLEDEQPREPG